jgi:hypothetical protein
MQSSFRPVHPLPPPSFLSPPILPCLFAPPPPCALSLHATSPSPSPSPCFVATPIYAACYSGILFLPSVCALVAGIFPCPVAFGECCFLVAGIIRCRAGRLKNQAGECDAVERRTGEPQFKGVWDWPASCFGEICSHLPENRMK